MSSYGRIQWGMGFFECYLTVWVVLCILAGIVLGKAAPGLARSLDEMAIYVDNAPVVSIPIARCLFFMMYPIMVKINFGEVVRPGKVFAVRLERVDGLMRGDRSVDVDIAA